MDMAGKEELMVKHIPDSSLNRREFLAYLTTLGGAAALAATLEGCAKAGLTTETPTAGMVETPPTAQVSPTTTPAITETETQPATTAAPAEPAENNQARVAFVKTNNRSEGVRRAVELLNLESFSGKSAFLKPNFNSSDPTPGSTHPEVLAALVTLLKDMGARQITVGDRSGMGDTRAVMEQLGVFRLAEELNFDAIVFDELESDAWVKFEPPGSHWGNGFWLARPMLEADAIVQTCCLKTHQYGGHFTLSMKNSVGMAARWHPGDDYDYMDELHSSAHQRKMIAEINSAYTPSLVVLDGVEAFISGGPAAGTRVTPEVILAGTDRVAIDAVGVALLRNFGCQTEAARGRIFEQEQIARAVELGLGVSSPEKIEFLTGDPDSLAYSEKIKEVLLAG